MGPVRTMAGRRDPQRSASRARSRPTKPKAMPERTIRVPAALRILLGWLFLGVLLVAAASYSQGTRYALVAEPAPALAAVQQAAAAHFHEPLNAAAGAELLHPASSVHARDGHDVSCPGDSPQHHACCDRYPASRSEPAPTKVAAPDPPTVAAAAGQQHVLQVAQEPEPRRQALTLDQLSISRT